MLKITVRGQNLLCDCDLAASDSIGYLTAIFHFSPDWTGLEKTVQFTQNDITYNVLIENDTCCLPAELTDGEVEISVFGQQAGGVKRITTIGKTVGIRKSGFVQDGQTPVPPTPDLYSQLLEKVESAVDGVSQLCPTKLSELENDTGFITADGFAVPTKLSELENDTDFVSADQLTIPANLSELEQDLTSLKFKNGIMTYSDKGIFPSGMSSFGINAFDLSISGHGISIGGSADSDEVHISHLVAPTADTDAVNKKYVDEKFSASEFDSLYIGNTRMYKDTNGNTHISGAANGQYDLDISGYNIAISGYSVSIGNNDSDWDVKIHNLVTPTADTDAANKKYVDDKVPTMVSELTNDAQYLSRVSTFSDDIRFASRTGIYISSNIKESGYVNITDVKPPEEDYDAVNKKYVDDITGDISTALDSILALQASYIGGDSE